jgi:hypothetical protein
MQEARTSRCILQLRSMNAWSPRKMSCLPGRGGGDRPHELEHQQAFAFLQFILAYWSPLSWNQLAKGTLRSLIRASGLTPDEFISLIGK